jgi:hypothetical protein
MSDADDVRERAEYLLRNTGITSDYGRRYGLGEDEARRAVTALLAAGLLQGGEAASVGAEPLSVVRAQATLDRRIGQDDVEIAMTGTVRLVWSNAACGFLTASHRGMHYQGKELAGAVDAYNAALADD